MCLPFGVMWYVLRYIYHIKRTVYYVLIYTVHSPSSPYCKFTIVISTFEFFDSEGDFEQLEVAPLSTPPELPDVMKPTESTSSHKQEQTAPVVWEPYACFLDNSAMVTVASPWLPLRRLGYRSVAFSAASSVVATFNDHRAYAATSCWCHSDAGLAAARIISTSKENTIMLLEQAQYYYSDRISYFLHAWWCNSL